MTVALLISISMILAKLVSISSLRSGMCLLACIVVAVLVFGVVFWLPMISLSRPTPKENMETTLVSGNQTEIKCKPHRPDQDGIKQITDHYGPLDRIESRKCDDNHYSDICAFGKTESRNQALSCDLKVCGKSEVEIASVDPKMGKAVTDWKLLPKDQIDVTVQKAVTSNLERGFNFLFLRCGSIFQVLSFPPVFRKVDGGKNRTKINLNVILLDSISRPHFYRILPRAVEALHKISHDPKIQATTLDFELVQGIGQQTFENIRPFFCGVLEDDNKVTASSKNTRASLGVEVLYGTFKKWGYQTLFQEDLCWYDVWGSVLTDIEKRAVPQSDSAFKERWKEFEEKVAKKQVDHQGITHFSCTALDKMLRRTNHYDYPQKICLNGKFYSWYFMNYITKVYTALKSDEKAKPLLSYMHFNTGHETNGKRMINMDANMAKFIINMASFSDTLTLILSDHGHTRTPFRNTKEGGKELYDPLFFMIVPDGVREKLGPQRMNALVTNQKRLFVLKDVHKAFMSLHDRQKMDSVDYSVTGIFSEIPANRTCADLEMLPAAKCKCEGFDEEIEIRENADDQKWLAEFAVGYINNAIQRQHREGGVNLYGYGNCERLVGKSFSKGIKRFRGEFIVTSMDIHVFPPTGYNEDEVFRVTVKQFAEPKDGVFFLNSIRVTTYSKFELCADKSVDIKLCACAKNQITRKEVLFENGVPSKMFGSTTVVKNLDSNCLLFMRRDYGSFSFALEVANVCTNTTYKFTMTGSTDQRIFTNTLPISLELPPKTFHFLTSVTKYIVKVDTDLNLKASIQVQNRESDTFHSLGTVEVS